ncbi:hypothetical protein C0995_014689 [Termitomyces sp. Mi166|nr:hypothetical protein C0995_014689 [Termitomyces sp. Mi166\
MSTLTLGAIENPDNLKTCQPYLMPFHIDYSGPAPISTYLRVNAAKETVGAPEAEQPNNDPQATSNSQDAGLSQELVAVADATDQEDKMETDATSALEASSTVDAPEPIEQPTGDAQATSDSQDAGPSQELVAAVDATDREDKMETDTTPAPEASSSPSKRVTDTTTRFISSFRGRTIQGLKVALPEGYVGVVLRGDGASDPKTRKGKGAQRRNLKSNGKRTTRSRNKTVPDEPESVDDKPMNVDQDEETRTLSVASQFSNFVLWHADHPVDEGRDEYLRSLNEWTRLAHLIHEVEE